MKAQNNYVKITLIFIILAFAPLIPLQAQDLSEHRWKDRLVLLLSDDLANPELRKQQQVLKGLKQELGDRKIVVYTVTPQFLYTGLKEVKKNRNNTIYEKYKKGEAAFQVVLLGLDGGVKLRENRVVKPEELFGLIDRMPMRRAELRNGGIP